LTGIMIEAPKIDRRVARTRDALHQTLMSLIVQKGYDEVSVADICDAANVGRSTFYAHFTCKDDLRRHGIDHVRRSILERHSEAMAANSDLHGRPFRFIPVLFEHARDHLDRYRALVGSDDGSIILATIRQTATDLVREELAREADTHSEDCVPRDLLVRYVVGAFMDVLAWWLDGGAKLPAERMDAIFDRLVAHGITPAASSASADS
jgi:AcrR family transcriptional regulator